MPSGCLGQVNDICNGHERGQFHFILLYYYSARNHDILIMALALALALALGMDIIQYPLLAQNIRSNAM